MYMLAEVDLTCTLPDHLNLSTCRKAASFLDHIRVLQSLWSEDKRLEDPVHSLIYNDILHYSGTKVGFKSNSHPL